MKPAELAIKISAGFFIAAVLFLSLKGCAVTVWLSPKSPEIYGIEGDDGRSMMMVFLPKNETMIWYHDSTRNTVEGVLTKMRGAYGTHYFGRLWNVSHSGATFYFGLRIYPPDTEPVIMEITVLERYMSGTGDAVFQAKGETATDVLLFGRERVRFQDMWLKRGPDHAETISNLLSKLGGSQEP